MQNYNFVKNDVFVAKICKYALYESSEGLFCAPRKAANFCHPVPEKNCVELIIIFFVFFFNCKRKGWRQKQNLIN